MEPPERVELPAAFEDVDVDVLVQLIADMMERLMAINDQIPLSPESLTRFHSRTPPAISVLDYLRRIVRFTRAERSCLLITLHYIDQVVARMPVFVLSSLTCHRFVIAAIAVSSKCLCDAFSSNSMYAKVGGIPLGEFNVLERELLRMIDWRLTVSIFPFCFHPSFPRPHLSTGRSATGLNPLLLRGPSGPHAAQCTREVLQEYYVSLVRTYSKGTYYINDALSSSGISSDSDMDYDATPSPTASPTTPSRPEPHPQSSGSNGSPAAARREPSTILIDTATLAPEAPQPPTVEQNLAFAAFQQHQQQQQQQKHGMDMDTS
ncbi:cyclin-domain-containing protein [Trametes punicea]|nr:cyclin-domain-containing protein [Trametes punicea]